jgi:hypothetical protein
MREEIGTELELGVPAVSLGRRLTAEFVGTALLVAIASRVTTGCSYWKTPSPPGPAWSP